MTPTDPTTPTVITVITGPITLPDGQILTTKNAARIARQASGALVRELRNTKKRGRPPLPEGAAPVVQVRYPQRERLEALARERGITYAALVKQALNEFLARETTH